MNTISITKQSTALSKVSADFTSLSEYITAGFQAVTACPNPLTYNTEYLAWLAKFGDYEPESTSFLKGKGVDIAGITDDLNGTTRLSPPTIGAHEAKGA